MATTINAFYAQNAMTYAAFSDGGLTITLPSEKHDGVFYDVQCKHTAHGVEAVQCQCRAFEYRKTCKHIDIVQQWHDAQASLSDAYNEPTANELREQYVAMLNPCEAA
jgi:hypothetical protein